MSEKESGVGANKTPVAAPVPEAPQKAADELVALARHMRLDPANNIRPKIGRLKALVEVLEKESAVCRGESHSQAYPIDGTIPHIDEAIQSYRTSPLSRGLHPSVVDTQKS